VSALLFTVLLTLAPQAFVQRAVQAPPVQACTPVDTGTFLQQLELARCYDRAWQWPDVEPAIRRALTLLESEKTGDPGTRPTGTPPLCGVDIPMPRRTKDASAEYPEAAIAAGVTGFVIVEIVIDEKGAVREATVARSVPGLDAAALRAARKWKYVPTLIAGTPAPVRAYAAVRFGQTLEPFPSDWLEFASFYYTQGLPTMARGAVLAALAKARDDRGRFDGYLDGRDAALTGVTMPVQTKTVKTGYPARALMAHADGLVHIAALVDRQGNVGRVRTVGSPSLLDAAAIDAVMQWKFTPALKGGLPVAMAIAIEFEFRLR
jgi:TonB family protein